MAFWEPCDLSDVPVRLSIEDVDADAANCDEEVVEIEVEYTDHLGRLLGCTVGWNGATGCADFVDIWDENGNPVAVDFDVREAIVQKALS
jgi:hypothetical protein